MKQFIFILFGVVMMALGIYVIINVQANRKIYTEKTIAVISDIKKETKNDPKLGKQTIYYPVIEYTVNNEKIKKQFPGTTTQIEYTKGEEIKILYDPTNETNIILHDFYRPIFVGIFLIIAGLILVIHSLTDTEFLLVAMTIAKHI